MAEIVRKRTSKWDVAAEPGILTEIMHENTLPAKVDEFSMEPTKLDSTNHDCNVISTLDENKTGHSLDLDGSEIDQPSQLSERVKYNDAVLSDKNLWERHQHSKQFNQESHWDDSTKKQGWDQLSQDQIFADGYTGNQNKTILDTSAVSPGPNERRKWGHKTSPTGDLNGFGRSHRKRSRSKSPSLSYDSRSRSRSWSRSPPYASKQRSERWEDKGRMRGTAAPCRDFSAGRCRRGSECRYLHESGSRRQIVRDNPTYERESRFERGRYLGYGNKDSFPDSRDKINHLREKLPRRHEGNYDDVRDNKEEQRSYKSSERCYDFTKGRCNRGASCRYVHHDASSSDGVWSGKDDSRVKDGNASSCRRLEPQRVSVVPCKFFAEGRCRHGESCRFSHQVGLTNNCVVGSHDDSQHNDVIASLKGGENESRVTSDGKNFGSRTKCVSLGLEMEGHQTLIHEDLKEAEPSALQIMNIESSAGLSAQVNFESTCEGKLQVELDFANKNLLQKTTAISENIEEIGQSQQMGPHAIHAQNFAPNPPFQQFDPRPSSDGQTQFLAHYVNTSMQNTAAHLPQSGPNLQNSEFLGQVQHTYDLNLQIQPDVQQPFKAQSQQSFIPGAQFHQNLCSHSVLSQQDVRLTGDGQKLFPPNQPPGPPNPESLDSDGKNHHSTLHNADSLQLAPQVREDPDTKSPLFNSDNSITQKLVTSEQAAKITDLSASLAHFFGAAALNSQAATSITPPQSFPSLTPNTTPPPSNTEESQANLNHLAASAPAGLDDKPHHGNSEMVQILQGGDALKNKKLPAEIQNGDEVQRDVDSRKMKEAKGVKMFKCALVEFVKDMLKPTWKEGQLSKEAHKTIVKKVVDKVTGSLQGPNLPQTQEKIDLYLSNSKTKLSKLVQAYVEKYAKS